MIETEHIEAIRDSVASVLPLLREITENSSPEPYTVENLWWTKLNVAISITAALIGGLGAYYGYKGFVYAKETARNVARLPQETQVKLCLSLLQDLLLNYVRAIVIFCNHKDGLKVPSDNYISNFILPEFEDIFNPESFYHNGTAFVCLNDLKSRMKHYNHMIEVIENHCISGGITDKDCKDLVIKTSKVTRSVFNFIKEIEYGTQEALKCKLIEKIAEQTNYRTENVELNSENKQMFHTLVSTMESHPGMVKFGNISLDLSSEVSKNIQFLSDNKEVPSTIEMLAYNGIIERRYLE